MKRNLSAVLIVVAAMLAACGGSGGGAAVPDASGNLTIELSEFQFSPSNIELKVGQKVTFTLINKGEKDHEFMVGRNVMMMEGAPNGFEHDLFEGMEPMVMRGGQMVGMEEMEGMATEMGHEGFMLEMPQGSDMATITFEVTQDMVGEWEIACFTDDGQHYEDGMRGKLVVNP